MGVISVGDDDQEVWGSSSALIRGLIEAAIEILGRQDFLLHGQHMMNWGYNHIDMGDFHVEELKALASIIPPYKASFLVAGDLRDETKLGVERLLDALSTRLDHYIAQREAKGQFIVERDLWTLRSAAEAERRLHNPSPVITDGPAFAAKLATLIAPEQAQDMRVAVEVNAEALGSVLTQLGDLAGRSFDQLTDPEATFRLIEDGVNPENEAGDDIADAINRHFIEAMLHASIAAGTWDRIQRHMGEETLKFATELYQFDYQLAQTSRLSEHEWQRMMALIHAAKTDDWQRFRQLSDAPFINEDAAHENFDHAVIVMKSLGRVHVKFAEVVKSRGIRGITVIVGEPAGGAEITLLLQSLSNRDDSLISVLVFAVRLNLS